LGEGADGKLFEAQYLNESQKVAVKIERQRAGHHCVPPTEVFSLGRAGKHPNVVEMRDYFYTPWVCITVLEYVPYPLLRVVEQCSPTGRLSLDTSGLCVRLIGKGVAHLHCHSLLHRDLHAGNVLIELGGFEPGSPISPDNIAKLVVCDLGRACDMLPDPSPDVPRSVGVGAPYVSAPEIMFCNGPQAASKRLGDELHKIC